METYPFYPPQMQPAQMPYQELIPGGVDCRHQLEGAEWREGVSVREDLSSYPTHEGNADAKCANP